MTRILVLVHRHGAFKGETYILRDVADRWVRDGHHVVVAAGPEMAVDADIAVNHVDLTVTPEDHVHVLGRYPKVVNGSLTDISKRRVSRGLLRRGDAWDGPVIVKSDRNNGGLAEARLAKRGLLPDKVYVPRYLLLESLADVDDAVWARPELVVERFEAEFEDGCFHARIWIFLGDRELGFRYSSREPLVKGPNVVRREPLRDVPEELRAARRELGMDFGSFDYGVVDGRVVLYDVNRTPIQGLAIPEDLRRERAGVLAEGLRSLL